MNDESESAGTRTRDALVASGIHLFGQRGYEGTSTRAIAAHAGANIAAIAYHFGGKAGLRAACGAIIAERLGAVVRVEVDADLAPDAAASRLEAAVRAIVGFLMLEPQANDIAAFMLREINHPGVVLDRVYSAMLEPRHRDLCRLWACATGGDAESAATKLAVFAMIGQAVYFRLGQPVILRRMDWQTVDADGARAIADLLARNLHSAIAAERRRLP
jgi:AcrR family transcriptional regulator